MKVRDMPYYNRPREKLFIRGAEAMSDEELMMVVLGNGVRGSDVKKLSAKVLDYFINAVSLNNVSLDYNELKKIRGIGEAKACMLVAFYELVSRIKEVYEKPITGARDVFKIVEFLSTKSQEYLVVLNLNGRNSMISKNIVTIGLLDQSLVHPREVFWKAISDRAASIIMVHNHPSGETNPSVDDVKTTQSIKDAGDIIGIPLLDHIIVSRRGYYSFKEKGML